MIAKVKGEQAYYQTVSRWLTIKYKYITKRHSLYEYAENNDDCLVYFEYKGKEYAMGQFMRLGYSSSVIPLEIGANLVGYDATDSYKPLLIQIDQFGEKVRLWRWKGETFN